MYHPHNECINAFTYCYDSVNVISLVGPIVIALGALTVVYYIKDNKKWEKMDLKRNMLEDKEG